LQPDPWDWASEGAWLRVRVGEEGAGRWWGEEEEWAWPEAEGAWPEAEGGWWLSPDSAFSKRVVRRGRGLAKPGRGSLCRWAWPGAEPGSGGWGTVRVGEGAGRWAGLLDACLESMGEGEGAWLRPEGAGLTEGKRGAGLQVTLGRFTAPPFWWEEPVGGEGRWAEVRAWQEGAESFLRAGWTEPAARAYSRALRLAVAAGGGVVPPPFLSPAELHAGLALCQLRLNLPAPAATNAGRALALDPTHVEARYRRGLAAAAMRDLEAAAADLGRVLREEPGHPGARRELRRVRGEARERDARLARRLGRLFA
uniref:FKBPL protein n=1 Tax=Calidris pygmaea TaxID=425635 RepID=A0A8C3JYB7_9CHAR